MRSHYNIKCISIIPLHYRFYDTFVLFLASSETQPHCKDPGIHSLNTVEQVTSQVLLFQAKQMSCCMLPRLQLLPYTKKIDSINTNVTGYGTLLTYYPQCLTNFRLAQWCSWGCLFF
jgi:hypothetical protein